MNRAPSGGANFAMTPTVGRAKSASLSFTALLIVTTADTRPAGKPLRCLQRFDAPQLRKDSSSGQLNKLVGPRRGLRRSARRDTKLLFNGSSTTGAYAVAEALRCVPPDNIFTGW